MTSSQWPCTLGRIAFAVLVTMLVAGCDSPTEAAIERAGLCADLTGAAPFGRSLHGTATFTLGSGATEQGKAEMQVFFPSGRAPGAPVVFAFPDWEDGLDTIQAVLDDHGGAPFSWSGSNFGDVAIKGALVGPAGGVAAHVTRNFADYASDIPISGGAEMTLCPEGELPTPFVGASQGIAPDSIIKVFFGSPLDASRVNVAAKLADGTAVAVDTRAQGQRLILSPRSGAFPPLQPIELTFDRAVDVIGRPFPNAVTVTPATERVGPPEAKVPSATERVDAIVGLGERDQKNSARIAVSWEMGCHEVRLTIVSQDGASARATVGLDARRFEGSIPLPGRGKQWLSVYAGGTRPRPQWLFPPPCDVRVESATLE